MEMGKWNRMIVVVLLCGACTAGAGDRLPALLDFGSKACIPCKMMAPVLEGMNDAFAGVLDVEFIDVGLKENVTRAREYKIATIPTQIFLDATGKELWRHEGFITRYGMLTKWRELGFDFAKAALDSPLKRYEVTAEAPAGPICFMCDAPIAADQAVTVPSDKGEVRICGVHHYFVMLSCLEKELAETEERATVAAADTGQPVPMRQAIFLVGADETSGRPWIAAFAGRAAAETARATKGGSLLGYDTLKRQEMTARCGFCDRAMYVQDGAIVKIGGIHSFGCCAHCSMGVAARTGGDIEVHEQDRLTGEPVVIRTFGGYVVSVEPATAVAWYGKKKGASGKWGSAGCFHQGFFVNAENLRQWLEANPRETGEQISIDQSLADKMAMTPQQIAKACKVGECAPK